MIKILFVFAALASMFSSQVCSAPQSLYDKVSFSAYNNGHQIIMTEEDVEKFDSLFAELIKDCRPMPAYGVSLHDETIKAMQEGVWVRFEFDQTLTVNELPFDELLIHLSRDMYGFNIIRGNQGKYEGRCFYIDVPRNMDKLYEFMLTLPVEDFVEETQETLALAQELKIKEVSVIEDEKTNKNIPSADCLPSINKENKDKSNTVI